LLTADDERCWLSQHQDAARAILLLTAGLGRPWWQERYPKLNWENANWVEALWQKRPTYGELETAVDEYLASHRGSTMARRLWRRLNAARDLLLGSNIRLVFSVAYQHTGQGLDVIDLVQEGLLGLMRSLEKFDVNQGTRFSTYSHYWIQQFIRLAIKNQADLIRKPTNVIDDMRRFQRQLVGIRQRQDAPLSTAQIAARLKMPEDKVQSFLEIGQTPLSLDAKLTEDGSDSWAEMLEDPGGSTHEQTQLLELSEQVKASLAFLNGRERVIIAMRYGIGHGREFGYREIADQLSISRERVRQIEKEALLKLRDQWPELDAID
jgi:RNA polymerase nonessential primary-like sigma factor